MAVNNEILINNLIDSGVLKTPTIINAFHQVDRKDFVPVSFWPRAYDDRPLAIGRGQTISQPTTVALMLELLSPQKGEKILDVGSGSGWTTALLATLVGSKGLVIGLEIIPALVKFGQDNLKKYNFPQAKIIQASSRLGHRSLAPFDRILVSAAAEELPLSLVEQLKIGGRLVLPILNSIWKIDKVGEREIKKTEFPGFIFVPLKSSD